MMLNHRQDSILKIDGSYVKYNYNKSRKRHFAFGIYVILHECNFKNQF